MCGIFGVGEYDNKTQEEVTRSLIKGLERMEYRGYDSAGMCIARDGEIVTYARAVGRVSNLKSKVLPLKESGSRGMFTGMAHTRWATHGQSTEKNAHPIQSDPTGVFIVVHNGIITNYSELRDMLVSKGYSFETQTDTEAAAKLALYYYDQDNSLEFDEIVRKVMSSCTGAFAFIFMSPRFPGLMIAARQSASIIVGVKNPSSESLKLDDSGSFSMGSAASTSFVVSSDITAIVEHTLKMVYLEDGDLAILSKKGIKIMPEPGEEQPSERKVVTASTNIDEAMKGNFAHFMIKEIQEQGESILNTMRNRVDFESKTVTLETLEPHKSKICNVSRYIFVACGTSYHSCLATRKVFEELAGCPVMVEIASHFLDLEPRIYKDDVVFFVSQSGETADTLSALKYCKKRNATTVGITNMPTSSIAKGTTCRLDLNAGVEKGVASTKAYTSQFMSIVLVAIFISQCKETCKQRREEIIGSMEELPDKIKECLKLDVDEFVDELDKKDTLIIIGRGYQAPTCFEGSLKIKEISYIHSEGILAGELKHGPLALVSKDKHIMMVIANDDFYHRSHSALEQVQARGGMPLVICTDDIKHRYSRSIGVPCTINCLQGLLTVIPFQLISYKLALKKGFDPDFPRNLAKSVTVE